MAFDTRDQKAVAALAAAQENGDVIGLKAVTGDIFPRLDIDDFLLNQKECFNLFLLALQALQQPDQQTNLMSYYQIAGIHGLPRVPWNNVNVNQKSKDARGFAGYCAHSLDTFPTWHRPYLALFEQTIYSKMVELVKQWEPESERGAQLKAASGFRLPYWDYWKPRGGSVTFPGIVTEGRQTAFDYDFRIPDIFVAKSVMVRKPKGTKLEPIDNPLASFNFPERQTNDTWRTVVQDRNGNNIWVNLWKPVTARYPGENLPVTAMNYSLNMRRESSSTQYQNIVRDPAYRYYSATGTNAMGSFGGGSKNRNDNPTGSLENIHNNYHGSIGSNGQMGDPSVAAFDPVFWIHHCQIDRLLAIWQATHPDSWFDGKQGEEDATNPLVPFTFDKKAGKDGSWTSMSVKDTAVFGYTYPDVEVGKSAKEVTDSYVQNYNWTTNNRRGTPPPQNMNPVAVFEKAQVFQYDPTTKDKLRAESERTGALEQALAEADRKTPARQVAQITISQPIAKQQTLLTRSVMPETPIVENRVLPEFAASDLAITDPKEIEEKDVQRTWFVDNVVERLALNGTFTMFFFIGKIDDSETAKYLIQPTLAGITHNFAAPAEICDNCGQQEAQRKMVSGTVLITPILRDYVLINQLDDLTPEKVKPFLVKHLKWRIVTVDGERIDPRLVRGLSLGISSKVVGPEPGRVRYQTHNDIIAEILQNASS